MTTSTAAKWSERVREWRASGKTAEEFASAFEFEASTLRYWASRLKTEAAGVAVPTIARVVRRRAQPSASLPGLREFSAERAVEVVVGSARILVRPGFDAELLRQVAAALGSLR
jgi:transposase